MPSALRKFNDIPATGYTAVKPKPKVKFRNSKVRRLPADSMVRIKCEDNIKFMSKLEPESMSLIVTSPPYNLQKEYEKSQSLDSYIESQRKCIAEAVKTFEAQWFYMLANWKLC